MNGKLVMDRRIVWDTNNMKEIEEAKQILRDWKKKGYRILLATGELMKHFRPHFGEAIVKASEVPKTMNVLKILSPTGDDRIIWDKENGAEALEAKAKFNELIKKGHLAFSVDSKGRRKTRITEFDVDAEEILMCPKTMKA